MGRKFRDRNGFLHLEGTPISRVQVAPYLGKQIDASGKAGLDPKKIYGVYRSASELFRPEVMDSFNGMPFRVGHQMLGAGEGAVKNTKKVDNTPIDGAFFNVRRGTDSDSVKSGDPKDYLFADIVIYTDRALRAIANGTTELSLGYRCAYVPKKGEWNGENYDYLQTNITANHLALVPHGRAGSSVCVQDEAILTEDGLVITCDSLPEEIQIMEENEKKAKDKLVALLKGKPEDVQDCLDYCDLTKEQKDAIKAMKADKEKSEATAEDKACGDKCKKKDVKDELPPPPPPAKEEEEKPAPVEGEEKPVTAEGEDKPAPAEVKPAPAPVEGEEKPVKEEPVQDAAPAKEEPAKEEPKMFTQDEMNEAIAKAKKEGREDGLRAQALGEAVGEDSDGLTEAEVARKACKKIKGLEHYAEDSASDAEVLAAVRGHLANQVAQDEALEEERKAKKTLLTVAQDEAIAKTPSSFSAAKLNEFLAQH